MQTKTMNTCLTFEQLRSYSLNKSELTERTQLYQHISTCELCACAVNGFTAIPFTSADVDAIHHQVDVRTNASHANPLTFAHVFIAGISVLAIFGFYQFADSFDQKTKPAAKTESVVPVVLSNVQEDPIVFEEVPVPIEPEIEVINETTVKTEAFEKVVVPVEPLASIKPDLIPVPVRIPEEISERVYNSNVIYIYDLKVTDYNSLYFSFPVKPFEVKGHTPASKENRSSLADMTEDEGDNTIAPDKILKSGLAYFNKGNYEKALNEFLYLLDHNPDDVNALFYSAVSYYHAGSYRHTIKNLEKVLEAENNTFHPEAKWNLALSHLKMGERSKAKQIFTEISGEKGFYSGRAAEKLRTL